MSLKVSETHADSQAFPVSAPISYLGLTKREYFAGLAMQSFQTNFEHAAYEEIATHAVRQADALIEALNKIFREAPERTNS